MTQYRFVGGPNDGLMVAIADGVTMVVGPETEWDDETLTIRPGWPQDMAYHRTHVHVGGSKDPEWWMRGLPEPQFETVFEWHEREWVPPAVQSIRDAVHEAARRF